MDLPTVRLPSAVLYSTPSNTPYTRRAPPPVAAWDAVCSLSDTDNTVDDVWVSQNYRGQKIFSKMLWFFKTRLGRSRLLLGPVHSPNMQEIIKGMSRFDKKWINIETDQVEPFDLNTLDQFYSYGGPTSWRLMLENTHKFNWPMRGGGFVKEQFSGYID